MSGVLGIHHVSAIAGDPQRNVDFYVGVLGLRLVKRSVNQDVPGTYHLFYADAEGRAGTDLTFFPWPDMPPGRQGVGLTTEVALAVPVGSLAYWAERLARLGVRVGALTTRFGERVLPVTDPHGLPLALVETVERPGFAPWLGSPIPSAYQIRGLHAVRLWERDLSVTATFLTETLGFVRQADEDGWRRFVLGTGESGRIVDIRELPGQSRGIWGTGSVHHVAWRVPDEAAELEVRARLVEARRHPTEVIDRFWFKSVYFKEPGGALFEIATDGPGFMVDESAEALGARLVLPPWLEPQRAAIEAGLPPLRVPGLEAAKR
jgi:glyoxalase family protein